MKSYLILKITGTTWYSISLIWYLSNWLKDIWRVWNGYSLNIDHPLSLVSLGITLFWTILHIRVITLLLTNFDKGVINLAFSSFLISFVFLSLFKSIIADPVRFAPIVFIMLSYSAIGLFALYVHDIRAKALLKDD